MGFWGHKPAGTSLYKKILGKPETALAPGASKTENFAGGTIRTSGDQIVAMAGSNDTPSPAIALDTFDV